MFIERVVFGSISELGTLASTFLGCYCIQGFLIFIICYILFNYHDIWMRLYCLYRDRLYLTALYKHDNVIKNAKDRQLMIYDLLKKHAEKIPNKPAYISAETGKQITFKEANNLANKIANFFIGKGFKKGDVIALMMENRIEYCPIWIGLSKIGVITALINTNAKNISLQHCFDVANAQCLIYTSMFIDHVKTIDTSSLLLCLWDKNSPYLNLDAISDTEPELCETNDNQIIYMYTSGTTGLPKAVIYKSPRAYFIANFLPVFLRIKSADICYNTLPLYHSSGGLISAGGCLSVGATMVLRQKFSASNFFIDCCKYECTFFIYIGEICRYLLAKAPQEIDRKHKIRFAVGNGLKRSMWKDFQIHFNIPKMHEFYGCTEGSFGLINILGYIGSVGSYPVWKNDRFGLMKVDKTTGCVARGADGLGIPVKIGEPGMFVTLINDDYAPFDGYTDEEANKKKIEYNVLNQGDEVFVFGDLLYRDKYGFYYFSDRLGDTYRWKGENVSTNEVEGIISKYLQQSDVCVYGVEIEGMEGKAGMACIADPTNKVNLSVLSNDMMNLLPSYARPMFLRISTNVKITSTFKFDKSKLRKAGFDPSKCINDGLFYFDVLRKQFYELNEDIYKKIQNKQIKF